MEEKQGQSCSDLKAKKSRKNKDILFCTVPAPDYGVSTTVSFWGWDNGGGKKTGIITVNATFSSGKTMLLKQFRVGKKVNWYHFDFILMDETISELKLYYNTGNKVKKIKLNLRDVWIRSTSEDDGKRPPEFCSQPMFIICIILNLLVCVGHVLFLRVFVPPVEYGPKVFYVHLLFMIMGGVGFSMLTTFFEDYPRGKRCKNDKYFQAAISLTCISFFPYLIVMFSRIFSLTCPDLKCLNIKSIFFIHIIEMISPSEPIKTSSDIIQIATHNLLENNLQNHYTPGTECPACFIRYTSKQPPIASQCGHIFCPGCTLNNCTVGKCPRCCFWTKIRPNKLMLVKIEHKEDDGVEIGVSVLPMLKFRSTILLVRVRKYRINLKS